MLVHELIGEKGVPGAVPLDWHRRYAEAVEMYFAGQWSDARDAFSAVLSLNPQDAAARLMLDRCEAYRTAPPEPPWDGIFRAPK